MQARSLSVVIRSPLRACMLINHRRPLGTAVDDGVIVQKFDPGRTPVRQALKELRQERLPCALPRPGMGGARCSPGHIAQPGPPAACRLPPAACRIWRIPSWLLAPARHGATAYGAGFSTQARPPE